MGTNQLSPFGIRPLKHMQTLGNENSEYRIASGYAENIGLFDVVTLLADGTIGKITNPAAESPIGIFLGGQITDRGKQGSLTELIPFFKDFKAGTVNKAGQQFAVSIMDDPNETLMAQVIGQAFEADRQKLVDPVSQAVREIYGSSGAGVTGPVQGNQISGAPTIVNGGTGYSDQTYAEIVSTHGAGEGGATMDLTIVGGIITAAALTNGGAGYGLLPTVSVNIVDPAGTGAGGDITVAVAALPASSTFAIERVVEYPIQHVSAVNGSHQGFGLSQDGNNAVVEMRFAKHMRK